MREQTNLVELYTIHYVTRNARKTHCTDQQQMIVSVEMRRQNGAPKHYSAKINVTSYDQKLVGSEVGEAGHTYR